jgi:hypothetical protein
MKDIKVKVFKIIQDQDRRQREERKVVNNPPPIIVPVPMPPR